MKNLFFGFILLCSFNAFSAMHDLGSTKITEVYINNGGVMLIQVNRYSGYISLGTVGDKTAEMFYSSALAAKSSQNNVWIRYWDSSTGYPTIGIISLK